MVKDTDDETKKLFIARNFDILIMQVCHFKINIQVKP